MSGSKYRRPDRATGPDWPADDAAALSWWLREGGAEELGRSVNKWLAVIDNASLKIWGARTNEGRRAFREVALQAINIGRDSGVIPKAVAAEKEIHARMAYVRGSDADNISRSDEMAAVIDVFLASIPMDLAAAETSALSWRNAPAPVIKSLRNIKTWLKLIEPGIEYTTPDYRTLLNGWFDLMPMLP